LINTFENQYNILPKDCDDVLKSINVLLETYKSFDYTKCGKRQLVAESYFYQIKDKKRILMFPVQKLREICLENTEKGARLCREISDGIQEIMKAAQSLNDCFVQTS